MSVKEWGSGADAEGAAPSANPAAGAESGGALGGSGALAERGSDNPVASAPTQGGTTMYGSAPRSGGSRLGHYDSEEVRKQEEEALASVEG